MPAPVRRTLLTAAPLALLALALAGVAMAAGNAGFAPEPGHSPNANRITDAYWVVFGFTAAIFLIVEGTLIAFIVKYRRGNRPRDAEGAEVHGHARLELIWTVIPVIILALIGTFVFYKLPGIKNTPPASAASRQNIHVVGHQFYWQFTYPDGQVSINELHLPVGKVAYFNVDAEDVIHSFWVPQLGGKIDAIPGKTNHIWFQPDKIGTFHGRCAEMCGLYHAKMPILVVSESGESYRSFLKQAPAQLGKAEFDGVCQTCHGIGGKGGYGPPLAGNSLTQQAKAIDQIVRFGRGAMPPVGRGWSDTQMKALTQYLKQHLKGGASGG
jgi:cytochrome c oxidase subunit II